jgi:hypothetical protein
MKKKFRPDGQISMKIICSLFLVICLAACQSSLIAELVTRSGQPLFHDDFSDPSSGWPQAVSANGTLEYTDGAYRMLVQSTGYDLLAVSRRAYRDAQIEVDATRLEGPKDNRFGLICRFINIDNFYDFFISSDGYYAIGKIKDGAASLLGQAMMVYSAAIVQDGSPNHLRFDCVGNTLSGYVNGQVVATTSDADFSDGASGLIAGAFDESGVEVSFDNFVVVKP